jgi:hypothetical protein
MILLPRVRLAGHVVEEKRKAEERAQNHAAFAQATATKKRTPLRRLSNNNLPHHTFGSIEGESQYDLPKAFKPQPERTFMQTTAGPVNSTAWAGQILSQILSADFFRFVSPFPFLFCARSPERGGAQQVDPHGR